MSCIISNILGGLGNQMFQYAAGRALALKHGALHRLDISDFSGYKLHQGFELSEVFNCKAAVADKQAVRQMLGWRSVPIIRRVLRRPQFAFLRGSRLVIEPQIHFWNGFFDLPADCYLAGYWQSEKYFKSIARALREDFAFKMEPSPKNKELAAQITESSSVSLHIRRGDFVTDAKTRKVQSPCSLEYYRSAIAWIAQRVGEVRLFVFSDDLSWVKAHFKTEFPCCFIDHNHGAESYNDMRLMSLCRHHIIANSSFSWWGAWLDPHPDKIVVAPREWFANKNNSDDLIPEEWARL